jgi:hypothetical protein
MPERDLKAIEFDKVMTLVMGMAASEPAREVRPEKILGPDWSSRRSGSD